MKWLGIVACVYLTALWVPDGFAGKKAEAANIKWAKGIAGDFLDALMSDQTPAASKLASPELRAGAESGEINIYPHLIDLTTSFDGFKFVSAEAAPSGKEVVLRGILEMKKENWRDGKPVKAKFTIRVAEEGPNGKWSIRFYQVTAEPF